MSGAQRESIKNVPSQPRTRRLGRSRILIWTVCLGLIPLTVWIIRSDFDSPTHAEIQREFQSFSPPSETQPVQTNDIPRSTGGAMGVYYTTSMTFADVRQHYENQLQTNGYKFREFKSLQSWGHDYGEQVLHYCKGNVMAELYNPGSVPTKTAYQFSFSISGNAFECR